MWKFKISLLFACIVLIYADDAGESRGHLQEVLEAAETPVGKVERVKSGSSAILKCVLRGDSQTMWEKIGEPNKTETLKPLTTVSDGLGIYVRLSLEFQKVTPENNGTYVCRTKDSTSGNTSMSTRVLVVTEEPEVMMVCAKAIGAGKVYLNWTVNDHNEPVTKYHIEYQKSDGDWESVVEEIDTRSSSFVVNGLEIGTAYRFRINAANSLGRRMPQIYPNYVTVTDKEPEYIPTITVAEKTNTSITIDISPPPTDLKDYDFYYNVTLTDGVNITRMSYSGANARTVIIGELKPETNYDIRIAACNFYTKTCGAWSAWISESSMGSTSSGLYPEWVNLAVANTVFLYFAVKHLLT